MIFRLDINKKWFKKYNHTLLIFLVLFPIYKYSSFNHGIGRLDSMPSIMKKNFKMSNNLVIDKKILTNCDKIYVISKNKILDNFVVAKLIYYKKEFELVDDNKSKLKCKI